MSYAQARKLALDGLAKATSSSSRRQFNCPATMRSSISTHSPFLSEIRANGSTSAEKTFSRLPWPDCQISTSERRLPGNVSAFSVIESVRSPRFIPMHFGRSTKTLWAKRWSRMHFCTIATIFLPNRSREFGPSRFANVSPNG